MIDAFSATRDSAFIPAATLVWGSPVAELSDIEIGPGCSGHANVDKILDPTVRMPTGRTRRTVMFDEAAVHLRIEPLRVGLSPALASRSGYLWLLLEGFSSTQLAADITRLDFSYEDLHLPDGLVVLDPETARRYPTFILPTQARPTAP